MASQKIGELNGRWALLLKINMVALPFVITWAAWITTQQFDRYTIENADRDRQPLEHRVAQVERRQEMILQKLEAILVAVTRLKKQPRGG